MWRFTHMWRLSLMWSLKMIPALHVFLSAIRRITIPRNSILFPLCESVATLSSSAIIVFNPHMQIGKSL